MYAAIITGPHADIVHTHICKELESAKRWAEGNIGDKQRVEIFELDLDSMVSHGKKQPSIAWQGD